MTKNQYKEKTLKEFEDKLKPICDGFDAWCEEHKYTQNKYETNETYLAVESFILSKLDQIVDLAFRECGMKENINNPYDRDNAMHQRGFNFCIDERSKLESNFLS